MNADIALKQFRYGVMAR